MIRPWDIAGAVQSAIMEVLGVSWCDMRRGGVECHAALSKWVGFGEWYAGSAPELRQKMDGTEVAEKLRASVVRSLGWSDDQAAAAGLSVQVAGHDERSGHMWVEWMAEVESEGAEG